MEEQAGKWRCPGVGVPQLIPLDADEDEDMDDDLADEDLIALARDSTMDEGAPAIAAPTVSTPTTLSHLLSTLSLPQRLTTLASLTLLSFPPATSQPSIHPPTTSALSVLHLRALEALNNLLLTTSASAGPDSQLADMIPAQGVWDGITTIVQMIVAEKEALSAKGQEMRGEVLEQALGCLWGLAKVAPSAFVRCPMLIPPSIISHSTSKAADAIDFGASGDSASDGCDPPAAQ